MNKFHKGDHVRVKSAQQLSRENRVEIGEEFQSAYGLGFLSEMWGACGQENTLAEQDDDNIHWWQLEFVLDADGTTDSLLWDESWLELAEKPVALSASELEELL